MMLPTKVHLAIMYCAALCRNYAGNLGEDKPEWATVALECARMIESEAADEAGHD